MSILRSILRRIFPAHSERQVIHDELERRVAASQAHVDEALAALKVESAHDQEFSQQIVNQLGRAIGHKE